MSAIAFFLPGTSFETLHKKCKEKEEFEQRLREDAELMMMNEKLAKKMGWRLNIPVQKWRGVRINGRGRITGLSFFLSGVCLEHLLGLVLPSELETLDFSGCGIGLKGLEEIFGAIPEFIRHLNLDGNKIGNGEGMDIMCKALQRLNLSSLRICANEIDDHGMVKLFNTLMSPHDIGEIYLCRNENSDECAEYIRKNFDDSVDLIF